MIDLYGLGATPITQLFNIAVAPPREIIDVEYEDVTDQVDAETTTSESELKLLGNNKQE